MSQLFGKSKKFDAIIMSNNIQNPVTDYRTGIQNNDGVVCKFHTLDRFGGFSNTDLRRVWRDGDSFLISLSGPCFEDQFRDPKCDCRTYYTTNVAWQLREGIKLDNGWRTCLYQIWDELSKAAKLFDDAVPVMRLDRTGCYGLNSHWWFCIRTNKDLKYIRDVLPKIFLQGIGFS